MRMPRRGFHVQRLMRAAVIVEGDPVADGAGRVVQAVEALAVDALLLQRPDHALDHAVLLGAVRGDELQLQAIAADEGRVLAAGKDQPVVGNDETWLATSLDQCDKLAYHAPPRDRRVGDRRQTFTRHVVHDVQHSEATAAGELIVDKVQRPPCVDFGLHQDRRPCPDCSSARLPFAHTEPFVAVKPINAIDARRLDALPQQDEQPETAKVSPAGESPRAGHLGPRYGKLAFKLQLSKRASTPRIVRTTESRT